MDESHPFTTHTLKYSKKKAASKPTNHLSGNITNYRIQLIHRIGLDKVEQLEHNNESRTYTIDQLKRIKRVYSKKAKLYKQFRHLD